MPLIRSLSEKGNKLASSVDAIAISDLSHLKKWTQIAVPNKIYQERGNCGEKKIAKQNGKVLRDNNNARQCNLTEATFKIAANAVKTCSPLTPRGESSLGARLGVNACLTGEMKRDMGDRGVHTCVCMQHHAA